MGPCPLAWALVLLGAVLALGSAPAPGAREKLCGHHFVRALVRVCGGPRWSSEDGRRVAGGDRPAPGFSPSPPPASSCHQSRTLLLPQRLLTTGPADPVSSLNPPRCGFRGSGDQTDLVW
ncbi:insulin-like 3 isoform X2 [Vulpes vulpes]|uniref:Insulin-like 3 isoform X2 n=1 Tax=Vulpes vulpes TaxID=9627 RepID=A0ABM4XA73_VULVU